MYGRRRSTHLAVTAPSVRCVFRQKVQPQAGQQALFDLVAPHHAQLGQTGDRRIRPRAHRHAVAQRQYQRSLHAAPAAAAAVAGDDGGGGGGCSGCCGVGSVVDRAAGDDAAVASVGK